MAQGSLAPWRDASLTLLTLQALILLLVPAVILYFCNRGIHWLLVRIRPTFSVIRVRVDLANEIVDRVCAKIASPFIASRALVAGVRAGWRALLRAFGHQVSDRVPMGASGRRIGETL